MSRSREEGLNRLYSFNIHPLTYNRVTDEAFLILSSKKGAALLSAMIHPDAATLQKSYDIGYYEDKAFIRAAEILNELGEKFFYQLCDEKSIKGVRLHGVDTVYKQAQDLFTLHAAHYEPDARSFAGEHHNHHSAQAGHHCDYD